MIVRPKLRSPAPALESGLDRAEGSIRNAASFTIAKSEPEADFAALYLMRRSGLVALTIAGLACHSAASACIASAGLPLKFGEARP